jgi:hypothetical protein
MALSDFISPVIRFGLDTHTLRFRCVSDLCHPTSSAVAARGGGEQRRRRTAGARDLRLFDLHELRIERAPS